MEFLKTFLDPNQPNHNDQLILVVAVGSNDTIFFVLEYDVPKIISSHQKNWWEKYLTPKILLISFNKTFYSP